METALLGPEFLHKKALETKSISVPLEELSLYRTVVGFISNSVGVNRAPAPFCGIYTTEYAIVPVPSALVDSEAERVMDRLREVGYFTLLRADALKRFKEEALLIICWDPKVILAEKEGVDPQAEVPTIECTLPGREGQPCNHCFDCQTFYGKSVEGACARHNAALNGN